MGLSGSVMGLLLLFYKTYFLEHRADSASNINEYQEYFLVVMATGA